MGAAIKAAKVYIKGLKKAGKKPTAAHEQSMIEAAAKAGEVAGKAKGGQQANASSCAHGWCRDCEEECSKSWSQGWRSRRVRKRKNWGEGCCQDGHGRTGT